jgi:hypothetical protein
MTQQNIESLEHKTLLDLLQKLDERVSRIELRLGAEPGAIETKAPAAATSRVEETASPGLEGKIGEVGLAWFGSVILLLGVAFLMTYTHNLGYRLFAGLSGFAAALGFYLASRAWIHTLPYLSNLMVGGSIVTLFYTTLRLHYYTAEPLIGDARLAFTALLLVAAFPVYFALKRKTEAAAVLAVLLGLIASLLSSDPHTGLALLVLISFVASFLAVTRAWWSVVCITSVLVYFCHIAWLLNNPLAGGEMRATTVDQYSLIYLFLCAAAFFWPALIRGRSSEEGSTALIFVNCAGLSFTLSMAVFALYRAHIGPPFLAASGFLLACSILQWSKTRKQLAPAIYACTGYLTMSIGIYGYAGVPTLFLWLALQSLVVVCMALWFRSKILVVANSVIFLGILLSYVGGFPSSNWVNFSFALVGHASARIMNWQKERLTLKTEILRNVYLVIGFTFVLYGLAHALPAHYVTLSWIAAAATYFLLSILLDNYKYRWLAVASVLVTIVYLLVVDLPQLEVKYRVPAFLAVGIITLVISIYYNRFRQLPGRK